VGTVIASGFTLGNIIRKRMGPPPLFLSPSYFTPLLPLVEQSPRFPQLDAFAMTCYYG
jgi:hypothetical protein